ncbi:MAG: ribonuclease P protein component [Victivallaceae bacterium]
MKQTLKSSDKLRLKSEFDYVREHGRKFVGGLFILVVAPSPDDKLRCGVICGKKYNKKAVTRNRARRLLWESFRMLKTNLAHAHLVMIPRQRMMESKQQEVQEQMQNLFKKSGLSPVLSNLSD